MRVDLVIWWLHVCLEYAHITIVCVCVCVCVPKQVLPLWESEPLNCNHWCTSLYLSKPYSSGLWPFLWAWSVLWRLAYIAYFCVLLMYDMLQMCFVVHNIVVILCNAHWPARECCYNCLMIWTTGIALVWVDSTQLVINRYLGDLSSNDTANVVLILKLQEFIGTKLM